MGSFAPEVIADESGKFCGNALRFATRDEAERWVRGLASRWFLVRETRVVESADPVNRRLVGGNLEEVKPADARVENHGSIFLVNPLTPAAEEWIQNHVDPDAQWFADKLVVEHRYVADIVAGMQGDGLEVQ